MTTDWALLARVELLAAELWRKAEAGGLSADDSAWLAALDRQRVRILRLPVPLPIHHSVTRPVEP